MECPYCKSPMTNGVIKCFRCAPTWKGASGEKFSFGRGKFLVNTTEGAWYCKTCDCMIIKTVGEKVIH